METLESSRDAKDSIAAHYETVSKLERYFPGLVKLAFKLANMLSQYCIKKRCNTNTLRFGTVAWTQDGYFTFHVEHDPFDLSLKEPPPFLQKGYDQVSKIAEEYPQVCDLIFRVMHQLAPMINEYRIDPTKITFTSLHWFIHYSSGKEMVGFQIRNGNVPMGWKKVGI